jgi:hypothetical protein
LSGKLQRKKEQDTQDILDYTNARRSKAKEIIESLLDELADEEKLRAANIVQIATVMGILIDKFVYLPEKIKNEKNRQEIMLLRVERTLPADSDCMENDTLISALQSAAGEVWPQEGEGIEES